MTKNLLVSLLLYLFAASASAFDLKKPPAPTDVESLAKQGWASSADQLSAALADAYVPGKNGRAGSSGDPAFTSWIDLWRACELLSKSCDSQTAALVQRHFLLDQSFPLAQRWLLHDFMPSLRRSGLRGLPPLQPHIPAEAHQKQNTRGDLAGLYGRGNSSPDWGGKSGT